MSSRSLCIMLFCVFSICHLGNVFGSNTNVNDKTQTKLNYVKLEVRKINSDQLSNLILELNSYEGKISEASYDETTRQLTVWYSQTISMVDVIQIVSKYTNDFSKIAGTEI